MQNRGEISLYENVGGEQKITSAVGRLDPWIGYFQAGDYSQRSKEKN